MRLCCGVDDRVDLLRLDHVLEQVGREDVALDEFVVRRVLDLVQVGEAAAVVHLIEVDHLHAARSRRELALLGNHAKVRGCTASVAHFRASSRTL